MAPGDRPAARKKPDKLRNLLKEAEQIAALRLKELNELSMQRVSSRGATATSAVKPA